MDLDEFTKLGDIWVPKIVYALIALLVIVGGLSAAFEGKEAGIYVILALPVAAIYFYPSILAYQRENRYRKPIAVVNLFFGWTVIGWAGALAWAYWPDKDDNVGNNVQSIVSSSPPVEQAEPTVTEALEPQTQSSTEKRLAALEHLAKLHESGVLTDAEFEVEKKRILDA